ncbi:hypothetical protein RYX36_024711 [Vicia faba]
MEEIGNQFVKIFLMKSFFQVAQYDGKCGIYSFKMHDLIHDLAIQVSNNDCCYLDSEIKRPIESHLIFLSVNLEYIYYEESLLSETPFPSLEDLGILECKKLKGWRRIRDGITCDDNSSQSYYFSFFPCVSYLTIIDCPMLTHMPNFQNLSEYLLLNDGKTDMVKITLSMVKSNFSIEFPPLSMLKSLSLAGHELDAKSLPNEWVENLTSLKDLGFHNLKNQEFQENEIWFKDRLKCLPWLKNLDIMLCSDLEAFPVWICNLLSLEYIYIGECQVLASLPDEMPRLTKLQTLEIIGCPLLIDGLLHVCINWIIE